MSIIKQIIVGVKEKFPKVKYVEASDPQIEDDSIYLNDELHIQVCCDNTFEVVKDLQNGCLSFTTAKTPKQIFKILEIN